MKKLLLILLCLPMIGFGQSSGTGFAINSKGYIATNFHVIDGAKNIQIMGVNGKYQKSYKATIVRVDKSNDLAILKIDVNLGNIPYGFKRNKEDVAASIYAYGYPLPEIQGYELKITNGIINSNSGFMDDPRWYQHTATIQSGNSGGPLFNQYGNLVGINNAVINNETVREKYGTEATNVNYAIKSRYLYNLMEDLDISSFVNQGINKMSLSEQYNKIKDFVYFISCPLTTNEKNLYDLYLMLSKSIMAMTTEYNQMLKEYKAYGAAYYMEEAKREGVSPEVIQQDKINEINWFHERITNFKINADKSFRKQVNEFGMSYDDVMRKFGFEDLK